jgi:hypothetical protein
MDLSAIGTTDDPNTVGSSQEVSMQEDEVAEECPETCATADTGADIGMGQPEEVRDCDEAVENQAANSHAQETETQAPMETSVEIEIDHASDTLFTLDEFEEEMNRQRDLDEAEETQHEEQEGEEEQEGADGQQPRR